MKVYTFAHKSTHYKACSGSQCHFTPCLGLEKMSCQSLIRMCREYGKGPIIGSLAMQKTMAGSQFQPIHESRLGELRKIRRSKQVLQAQAGWQVGSRNQKVGVHKQPNQPLSWILIQNRRCLASAICREPFESGSLKPAGWIVVRRHVGDPCPWVWRDIKILLWIRYCGIFSVTCGLCFTFIYHDFCHVV